MTTNTLPPSDDPATELATTQRNLTLWFDRAKALEARLAANDETNHWFHVANQRAIDKIDLQRKNQALTLALTDQQNARWLAITLAVLAAGVVGLVVGAGL